MAVLQHAGELGMPANWSTGMSRRLYIVPAVKGSHHVCFDTHNLFGVYGETLMWFVKWECLRVRRLSRGKAIPYPQNEETLQQVQTVATLIRKREMMEEEWCKQKSSADAAQLHDQIQKLQHEITALSTPLLCFAERYNWQIHRQDALRSGLVILGQRMGTSPVEMSRFVDECELAIMQLAQWDKSQDWV